MDIQIPRQSGIVENRAGSHTPFLGKNFFSKSRALLPAPSGTLASAPLGRVLGLRRTALARRVTTPVGSPVLDTPIPFLFSSCLWSSSPCFGCVSCPYLFIPLSRGWPGKRRLPYWSSSFPSSSRSWMPSARCPMARRSTLSAMLSPSQSRSL